jgi:hypothetical protein
MPVGFLTGQIGFVSGGATEDFEAIPLGPLDPNAFPGPLLVSGQAEVIQKTATDRALILAPRGWMVYPFQAPGWVDLRIGFFSSLTQSVADDAITGLGEVRSLSTDPRDFAWIGLKTNGPAFIGSPGQRFIGWTNVIPGLGGQSRLISSDIGLGTTNTNYWRLDNINDPNAVFQIIDGYGRAKGQDGAQLHYPQSEAGAGGYCVLHAMQIQRWSVGSTYVTVRIKSELHSGDILYSSDPTKALFENSLANFTTNPFQQLGPLTLTALPDALYAYWPFSNSRLRIHVCGVYKAK